MIKCVPTNDANLADPLTPALALFFMKKYKLLSAIYTK